MRKFILSMVSIFALAACGGGGSDDNSGGDDQVGISLAALTSTESHSVYGGNLEGEDSNGAALGGYFFIAYSPPEMLGGVLVTPQDLGLQIGAGGPTYETLYLDSAGYILQFTAELSPGSEMICTPASPYRYPDRVVAGDSGVFTTMECSIPRIHDLSWRVEDAGEGSILFIVRTEEKELDSFTSSYRTIKVTEVGYKLDSAGLIIGYSMRITYEQGSKRTIYLEKVG